MTSIDNKCRICPRKCNVNRDERVGYCGMSNTVRLARAALHYWEEPFISGEEGSGAIFFSGCNLKCIYCQNYDISRGQGKDITIKRLADIFKELEDKGANNINLVTASHYVPQILKAFDIYKPQIPIVYNCGGYESQETLKMLEGVIDVYLPDLKYSDENLAYRYSKARDYFDVATNAINIMQKQVGECIFNEKGILEKGVVVRHLVLPGQLKNTEGVLKWLSHNLKKGNYFSLMGQFIPYGECDSYPEINRKLKPLEYKIAINKAIEYGLENTMIQELNSASEEFVPDFNNEGV